MGTDVDLRNSFVETDGIRLHIVEAGPDNGRLVILLHGFPEFWYGWRYQIPALAAAGFHVVAPDQRGYNLSDKPQDLSAYRLDVLARDITSLMGALGQEKASLVGHDWGGLVAWAVAVLYPKRVEKLAVLNAPYPLAPVWTIFRHPEQLLRSVYIYFFQLPLIPEAVLRKDDWEWLVVGMHSTSRPGAFTAEDIEYYRQAWWKKGAMTSMIHWYRALVRRPARLPLKPRLSMPVLILWGAQDFALGRELAEASIELCDHGKLVFFEQASHWVQHEEVEGVNRWLMDFLY